LTQQRRAA